MNFLNDNIMGSLYTPVVKTTKKSMNQMKSEGLISTRKLKLPRWRLLV